METTTPPPLPRIWPTLLYKDARAAIAFLESAFGWKATIIVPNPEDDSIIEHCQMINPEGGGVMLGTANRAENRFSMRTPGSSSAYVVTADPDGLFAKSTAAGAEVFHPLEDQDYGSRDFSVKDPEGNIWSFGTYTGEV